MRGCRRRARVCGRGFHVPICQPTPFILSRRVCRRGLTTTAGLRTTRQRTRRTRASRGGYGGVTCRGGGGGGGGSSLVDGGWDAGGRGKSGVVRHRSSLSFLFGLDDAAWRRHRGRPTTDHCPLDGLVGEFFARLPRCFFGDDGGGLLGGTGEYGGGVIERGVEPAVVGIVSSSRTWEGVRRPGTLRW